MMRLSPRLICFIGAAGTFQSTLAAQEDPGYDRMTNLMEEQPFVVGAAHVRKFDKMNEFPNTTFFKGKIIKLKVDSEDIHSVIKLNSHHYGKHRILELQSDHETRYLCNITSIEDKGDEWFEDSVRYVFTGMECRFSPIERAQGPQITNVAKFEIFVRNGIQTLAQLRNELITAFEMPAHKFKVSVSDNKDGKFKGFSYYTSEYKKLKEYKFEKPKDTVLYFGHDAQCKPLVAYVSGKKEVKAVQLTKFILHQYRDSNNKVIANPHFAKKMNVETNVEFILEGENKIVVDGQLQDPEKMKKYLHFCPIRRDIDEDLCNQVNELYGEELFQYNFNGRQAAKPSDFEFLTVEETEDVEPAVDAQDEVPETLIQRMLRNGIELGGPQAQQDRNRALKREAEKRTS